MTVIDFSPVDESSGILTYRADDGAVDTSVLDSSAIGKLSAVQDRPARPFTADAGAFKLGIEALRIGRSAQFDPTPAVTTSPIDPHPHQLEVVYEQLLNNARPKRFVLADDPGAGKTIMAGVYIKELVLRGSLDRCLIVVPGGLVQQWRHELLDKLGLYFTELTADAMKDPAAFFAHHRLVIARMDQLARGVSTEKQQKDLRVAREVGDHAKTEKLAAHIERAQRLHGALQEVAWDAVVVDEAHRMSAGVSNGEVDTTARFRLGRLLSSATRHLLLMTATPHNGKNDEFGLFLSLLDDTRYGRSRGPSRGAPDTRGIMRRLLKEDLVTFDGAPLFPPRRAETVFYGLSGPEHRLYRAVSDYVRTHMARVEKMKEGQDAQTRERSHNIGFALTLLQRRLASSPAAILQTLMRRRDKLTQSLEQQLRGPAAATEQARKDELDKLYNADVDEHEVGFAKLEELEEKIADRLSTAKTAEELRAELAELTNLITAAQAVYDSGEDRKWREVQEFLAQDARFRDDQGQLRKLIIFTEHRDTLDYLTERIAPLVDHESGVVAIHGGMQRAQRERVTEQFWNRPHCRVLVATDAAGEGLNLHCAHLMINYDLPWNPNRIEQRFGRIHRIGQRETCYLWNLVAEGTREGGVFRTLMRKIDNQKQAYADQVFDVLGQSFRETSLEDLMLDAIRYGDSKKADIERVLDDTVQESLRRLEGRMADRDVLNRVQQARTRKLLRGPAPLRLQPHYTREFFRAAYGLRRGRLTDLGDGTFDLGEIPKSIHDQAQRKRGTHRGIGNTRRVVFGRSPEPVSADTGASATSAGLLGPGHPLFDTVSSMIEERHAAALGEGAVLVDRTDPATSARLLVITEHTVTDTRPRPYVLSRRLDAVEVTADGPVPVSPDRHLDYGPLSRAESRLLADEPPRSPNPGSAEEQAVEWVVRATAMTSAIVSAARCDRSGS